MHRPISRLSILVLTSLLVSACGFKASRATTPALQHQPGKTQEVLTKTEALLRSNMIADVDYEVYLDITDQAAETYSGRVSALINLSRTDQPLRMDFNGGEIHRLLINEASVSPDYDGHRLTLPRERLQTGGNMVEIEYTRPYSRDGQGLYRFLDPVDDRVYLYSSFEPYSANRMFPHFDQPDLKASIRLTVRAPEDWQVISSTRERQVIRDGKQRWWYFPASQKISTYVFSLHAGPYKVWEDRDFRTPLRLMVRQSRAREVNPETWFRLTRQGFDFYEEYFDIPYPYHKYDQLIVPEFRTDAVENVAAVTYSEADLSERPMSDHDEMNLARIILHKQAQMWFGNLVTMKWWDGLWLKESFTNYMAFQAMVEGIGLKDGWQRFFADIKLWGYDTDTLVTTHPIASTVRDSNEAFLNVDGITYGKGSSVLQQLNYFVGPDAFRQGVREYLKLYQQRNTGLEDFTRALERASGRDLAEWTKEWLRTSGVNRVQADFQCKAGLLKKLELYQQPPAQGDRILRSQTLNVGFYRLKNDELELYRAIPVALKGKKNVVDVPGQQPCPAFIYPNTDDWGYLQVSLDSKAQKMALKHRVRSPLLRSMIWSHLQEAFQEGQLPLAVLLDTLYQRLPDEENEIVLRQKLNSLNELYNYLQLFAGSFNERSGKLPLIREMLQDIQEFAWHQLSIAEPDTERQLLWFNTYLTVAHTRNGLQRLAEILDKRLALPGLTVAQDQRWAMIIALNQYSFSGAWQWVRTERESDRSPRGRHFALMADVSRPDITIKRQWLNRLLQPDDKASYSDANIAAVALFPAGQTRIALAMSEEILSELRQVNQRSLIIQDSYSHYLVTNECSEEGVERLERALKENQSASTLITRALKEKAQKARKCLSIRERFLNPEGG
ncbi:MAG: aminopeptidase N [Endozoicomonas sp.]